MFNIADKISLSLIAALFVMSFTFDFKECLYIALGIAVTRLISALLE